MRHGRQCPQFTCISALTKSPGFTRRHFRADFFHVAAEFVAKRHRRMDARSGPAIPAVDVQVGAANRSGAHAHQHLRGAWTWEWERIRAARPARERILRKAFIVDVGIVY